MRILRVHNRYQQRGGEDAVFEAEVALLQTYGDDVQIIDLSNDTIDTSRSPITTASLAIGTVWSKQGRRLVADAVARFEPDIVHFDNTFPLISPAAYAVARRHGAAVVQTLHNFRLLCPAATLYRDGAVCEDCLGKAPVPGIVHGCYRQSRAQTGVVAAMLVSHRTRRTWSRDVDRYITLTEFARGKFVEGGLPADRLQVKPNFVDTMAPTLTERGDHLLYVGRLAEEKGIQTLLAAQTLHQRPVRVAGSGPLSGQLGTDPASDGTLTWLGLLGRDQVRMEMTRAQALIFPSEWYEGFPVTIAEAFASGLPVIASRLGSMAELVDDGVTGLLFTPGDAHDLAAKIEWASMHPGELGRMGENARRVYEAKYTPERNYEMLMDVYRQAIAQRQQRPA